MKNLTLLKGMRTLAILAIISSSSSAVFAQTAVKATTASSKPAAKKTSTTSTTATTTTKAKPASASPAKKAPVKTTATSKTATTTQKSAPVLAVTTPAAAPATETAVTSSVATPAALASQREGAGAFAGGSNVVSFGIGLVNNLSYPKEGSTILPLTLSYERGLNVTAGPGVIGVGGTVSYFQHTWEEDFKYSVLYFAAKGAYHYDVAKNDKLDTYAGLTLGYALEKVNWESYYGDADTSNGEVKIGFLAGARYYFTQSMGAHVELETGPMSHITLGVNYRF